MTEEHLTRQLDLIPMEKLKAPITVIGAGAIGSFVVLNLAKMGFHDITVWDFDEVSPENMNCQWYRHKDIGRPKVTALKEIIHDFTDTEIKVRDVRWEGQPLEGIVITAVDSMRVRKQVWDFVKDKPSVRWLIDPRMSAEYALSFVVDPSSTKDQKTYEGKFYTDGEAIQERCTAKATMYTATMISGYVAKHVKDLVTESPYARITEWDIGLNNMLNWRTNENPVSGDARCS